MGRFFLVACQLICLVACKGAAPEQTTSQRLLDLVNTAKARGESSIETSLVIERDSDTTLDMVLKSDSVLVATPVGSRQTMIVGDAILTSVEFRVDQWLSRRLSPPDYCKHLLMPGAAQQGLVIAGIMAGSVMVEGVRITELTDSAMVFDSEKQYLLFVAACPDNSIGFRYGAHGVFVVNSDGTLSPAPYNHPTVPFVAEVFALATLNGLEAHLKGIGR